MEDIALHILKNLLQVFCATNVYVYRAIRFALNNVLKQSFIGLQAVKFSNRQA